MRTVALISGGKDSCFNMMHCVANGHEITSLANLHPPSSGKDEMDSWMYQTVGHDIIQLYSAALNLPLYRQEISGKNIQQSLHYNQALGDETEDLYNLLTKVIEEMPDTQAVSVGAIASNYQRLRVENVASRLGLTVLSYLWERDQTTLLQEMIDNGLEAILIKVACVGLTSKHLGRSLAQIESRMAILKERFEVHPCGEGGEYESIVLDCPLFKKKLVITNREIVHLESDTAYLKLEAKVEDKQRYTDDWQTPLRQAISLAAENQRLLARLEALPLHDDDPSIQIPHTEIRHTAPAKVTGEPEIISNGIYTCTKYTITADSPPLSTLLPDFRDDILFCTLILRSMSDFTAINKAYGSLWTSSHPPSRVCYSTALPEGVEYFLYTISLSHRRNSLERRLWVQSRSYWAPSNIGPYSQVSIANGLAFISGQIGLVPATMEMPHTVNEEIVWSLQSLGRVLKSVKIDHWHGIMLCYVLDARHVKHAELAFQVMWPSNDIKLVIIQMTPGSELPRNAQVEWQLTAFDEIGPAQISLVKDITECDDVLMVVDASNKSHLTSHIWRVAAQRLWVEGQYTDSVGIRFGAKQEFSEEYQDQAE